MAEYFRDIIYHMTTKIEVLHKDGSNSTGTGFFHAFNREGDNGKLCVVTNKHVVNNYETIKFTFTNTSPNGGPLLGHHKSFGYRFNPQLVVNHPDPNVDLAAIPIMPLVIHAQEVGFNPFYKCTTEEAIGRDALYSEIFSTPDILMVGYPIGIWDQVNNLPIVRKGICSTPPSLKYNGKNEFIIDAHCFPGSSGSPIFIADTGTIFSKTTNTVSFGNRIALIGILYAGPQYTADGKIVVKNIPTTSIHVAETSVPAGLGNCINANELDGIESLLTGGVTFSNDVFIEIHDDKVFP